MTAGVASGSGAEAAPYPGGAAAATRALAPIGYLLLLGILAVLVVYPIGLLMYGVISKASPQELNFSIDNLTTQHVVTLLQSKAFLNATWTSLLGAGGGMILSILIALYLAFIVNRTDVPWRPAVEVIAITPLFMSPLVGAIAWATLGMPHSGLINLAGRELGWGETFNIGSLLGVAFVMGLYYAPYAYLLISSSLKNIDPSLEEAAFTCGASSRQSVVRVVLPLMAPTIYGAMILVFVTLLALYSIPYILGEPQGVIFLVTYMWRFLHQTPPDYQGAAAIGLMLCILTLLLTKLQGRVLAGRSHATVTGKAYRQRVIPVGRWKYPLLAGAFVYILLAAVIPYLVVGLLSFRSTVFFSGIGDVLSVSKLSFTEFASVMSRADLQRSVVNSLIVGVASGFAGVCLTFCIAYIIVKTRAPLRHLIELVSNLPVAVPSIIVGIAFLWAWIALPLGIYGTIWIIVAAFVAKHIPEGVKSATSNLIQLHPELEESAWTTGASRARGIRLIVVPLVRSGLVAGFVLLFVFSVRELGPALFLYNSSTTVMPVQVLASWEGGDIRAAAAISLVQSVLLLLVVLVARYLFAAKTTPGAGA